VSGVDIVGWDLVNNEPAFADAPQADVDLFA